MRKHVMAADRVSFAVMSSGKYVLFWEAGILYGFCKYVKIKQYENNWESGFHMATEESISYRK